MTADRAFPLTPMQQGILFASLNEQDPGNYLQQLVITLPEALDVARFRAAWQQTADRHPMLRTRYQWRAAGEPAQVPEDSVAIDLTEHDWRPVPPGERAARLAAFLRDDRRRGVALDQAPNWRLTLLRYGDADWRCVWTFSHIILDGRAHYLVLQEALDRYDGQPVEGPEPPPFRAHVARLGQQDLAASERFYRDLLQGFSAPTPVGLRVRAPGTPPEPIAERHGVRWHTFSADLTARLRKVAEAQNWTLNTLLQGAWAILLGRYSGEEVVVFGATRACRKTSVPDADAMIGLLINTLPVRARLTPGRTAKDLLGDLRQQGREVWYHEQTSLIQIHGWSAVPRNAALFNSILVYENNDPAETLPARGGPWAGRRLELHEQVDVPILLACYAGTELRVKTLYLRSHWDDASLARLLGHLEVVLTNLADNLDQAVDAVPVLTAAERQQIVYAWNATAAPYPDDHTIHQLMEEQTARTPDAVAVTFPDGQWTYAELNAGANRLAHFLRAQGARPGVRVAVCLERGPALNRAILAILKSGAAYVPLDADYPQDRLGYMLEDSESALLLTETALRERFPGAPGTQVLLLDTLAAELDRQPAGNPAPLATPDDHAYIIYTSGSTGKPKGVLLRHQPVVNLLDWVNKTYKVGPGDKLLWVTSPNFDLSVYDMFGIWGCGACLRATTAAEQKDPRRLVQILAEEGITFWDSAPPMLQQCVPFFPKTPPPGQQLRLVFLSGDWIPVPLPDAVRASYPGAQPVSLGGATEAAIWSNYYDVGTVEPDWPSIPYGKPCQNARYHVLDAHLAPLPVGVAGELFIGGDCLAEGYWRRPELTAERFLPDPFFNAERGARNAELPNPGTPASETPRPAPRAPRLYRTGDRSRYFPDGNLEFLGRLDNQVKIRGYRIELGEIETEMTRFPAVREAAVVARADGSGQKNLVGYVVANEGQIVDVAALKRHLMDHLPAYMVPAHVIALDAFPLNPNGKVDRKALPAPEAAATGQRSVRPPRTPLEETLVILWQDVLNVRPVGINDNFFELGGHSLLAARLFARIEEATGQALPLRTLLTAPTVAQLAELLAAPASAKAAESCAVPLHPTGRRPPVFFIAGIGGHVFTFRELADHLGPDQPSYGLEAVGVNGREPPPERFEDIAAHYLEEINQVRPAGPFVLAGYSLGGRIAYELAQQAAAAGRPPALVVMLDAPAPGYPRKLPLGRRVRIHLGNFLKLPLAAKQAYLAQRLDNVWWRVKRRAGILPTAQQAGFDLDSPVLDRVFQALLRADEAYRPRPYTGRVAVLAATDHPDWPATEFDDPDLGWGDLVKGGIDHAEIPGAHLKIFEGANVPVLAELLRTLLAKIG